MKLPIFILLLLANVAFADGYLCVTNGTTLIGAGGGSGGSPPLCGYITRTNGTTVIGAGGGSGSAGDGVLAVTNGVTVIGPGPTSGNDPVFASVTHVWHLGEASGNSRADSVGSISLTEVGGAVASATGIHGNAAHTTDCFELDGTFSETTSFSVSLWLKLDSFDDSSPVIFNKLSGITEYNLTVSDGDGGGRLTTAQYHPLVGADISLDISSLNITVGQWFFVVLTFNGATGSHSISVNGGTFSTASGTPYLVGSGILSIVDSLNCNAFAIDELYYYSSVLTQGNVTTLYGGGTPTVFYSP